MWDDETILLIDRLNKEIKETKSALNSLRQQVQGDLQTYNNVLQALRSGELSWDRVQIMESGQLHILQEEPALPDVTPAETLPETAIEMPCDPEIAKSIERAKNGKNREAANVT